MNKILKFYCLAIITLFSTVTMTQNTISIQSTLKSISGEAVTDGMQSITFNLYTVLEGGTAIWTETADVEVVSGIYSHELGIVTPLVAADFGQQLYLGVTINNKELDPRTKLGFAPYAMAVTSIAANGASASFDGTGKLVVSGDMSVIGNIEADKIGVDGANTANNDVDIAINSANTGIGGAANSLSFYVNNSTNPKMTITNDGRLGIGTIYPETGLHVSFPGEQGGFAGSWFKAEDEHLRHPGGGYVADPVAYFEGDIIAFGKVGATSLASWSDKRIKTNLKKSNAKKDLTLLNKIEITEYDHIDKVNNDRRRQKKIIAQQVEQVLPNAIDKSILVIPNVYQVAKEFKYEAGILSVETEKLHNFVVGDKIDLKTPKRKLDRVEVIAIIDDHTFSVKAEEKPEHVFVYGKYIDDFLSVDYDAISMLNVSASQEMYRMIIDLQAANKKLTEENKALKSSSVSIEDRLSSLEALLLKSNDDKVNYTGSTEK